jgi:hypothetical protein
MNYLSRAIGNLKPNSEFVITDGDYSTIVWHKIEGDAPSQKQIDDEIKAIKKAEADAANAQAVAAASAISKLEALGLTADEIAAIRL